MNARVDPKAMSSVNLQHYWMPFTDNRRFKAKPRLIASAKDMYFTTVEGNEVLDGLATLWCVNAGHGRPRIVEAIRSQAVGQTGRRPSPLPRSPIHSDLPSK